MVGIGGIVFACTKFVVGQMMMIIRISTKTIRSSVILICQKPCAFLAWNKYTATCSSAA